jgi:hypothetical protein
MKQENLPRVKSQMSLYCYTVTNYPVRNRASLNCFREVTWKDCHSETCGIKQRMKMRQEDRTEARNPLEPITPLHRTNTEECSYYFTCTCMLIKIMFVQCDCIVSKKSKYSFLYFIKFNQGRIQINKLS